MKQTVAQRASAFIFMGVTWGGIAIAAATAGIPFQSEIQIFNLVYTVNQ